MWLSADSRLLVPACAEHDGPESVDVGVGSTGGEAHTKSFDGGWRRRGGSGGGRDRIERDTAGFALMIEYADVTMMCFASLPAAATLLMIFRQCEACLTKGLGSHNKKRPSTLSVFSAVSAGCCPIVLSCLLLRLFQFGDCLHLFRTASITHYLRSTPIKAIVDESIG